MRRGKVEWGGCEWFRAMASSVSALSGSCISGRQFSRDVAACAVARALGQSPPVCATGSPVYGRACPKRGLPLPESAITIRLNHLLPKRDFHLLACQRSKAAHRKFSGLPVEERALSSNAQWNAKGLLDPTLEKAHGQAGVPHREHNSSIDPGIGCNAHGRTGCDAQVDGIEGANPICSFHLLTRSMSAITAVEAGWIGGNPDQQHGWRIFNTSGIPFKPRPVLGLSQFPHFADELVFAGFVLNRHHPDVINAPGFRRGSGSGGH